MLEAEGLAVSLRAGRRAFEVLRGISFRLDAGEVLGLVGESGAGKSMLGRVVAGNLPEGFAVSAGSLRFAGRDLAAMPRAERRTLLGDRIAFIPQEPLTALNPLLTVGQQFAEHLARLAVPKPERVPRMLAALAAVRLPDPPAIARRYPFQLSGGQCQRVLIALAFASTPALVVADEPTTALDVSTQARIVELIRAMQVRHRTALLFITHDLRLAGHVCDRIMVLHAGEAVEHGPAAAVLSRPRHPYTRALVGALPPLSGPRRRLAALPEQMPGIAAFAALPGCRFAPRCPVRDAACAAAPPGAVEISPGHLVRAAGACLSPPAGVLDAAPLAAPPAAHGPPLLSLRGIAKTYPGRRPLFGPPEPGVAAVLPLDLDIRGGEFIGVVGESGSGKSTLARLVMGLETPSAGRILLDGADVTGDLRARLGTAQMVFQDPQSALNPRRSVLSLVTQALESPLFRATAPDRAARARALLRQTGLPEEILPRFPAQLSGGQKQRVNIARALCVTPRLLVADEIVSGLDVSVQAQILNLLLDLRARTGIALLFISHDLAVVRTLCERVVVMHRGAVVEEGRTEEVFAAPRHPYTRALLAAVPPEDASRPWPPPEAAFAA
ncbi:MAG: ABC transporter ATP-binding protein [Acetobacteraceae bacterium]|nr:ABC transporter ATP-binding protein [Acetobacteraceae bacterium]